MSIELLFGLTLLLLVVLALFEATAYWHARNVLGDAAADGVRSAAAYGGSCDAGIAVARQAVAAHAGSWADDVSVGCVDAGDRVTVTVRAVTPGVLGESLGFTASVAASAPKEV